MAYLLGSIILILLVAIYFQYKTNKETSDNLRYISEKMNHIISEGTSERLLLVTDDKELKELLTELNRLLAYNHEVRAESARMKMSMNRMLSNVSHDLKTPLTVVLGYIETLRQDRSSSPDERDVLLSKVQSKATEVLGLINKFFDLARLESGDWKMDWKRVHINEVCRKVMLGYYDTLTNKGVEVMIDIPKVPIYVYADEDALYRVLDNLLSNAIRYGNDGNVVGLTLRYDDDYVFIDVWDRGKGIRETERDRIFERSSTLEDSRSASTEGSGLGLTITKQLTEQMNGRIDLSSVPYERTVFTVRFEKSR